MTDQRTIRCSRCSKLLKVDSRPQDFRVKCPGCEAILRIPGGSASNSPTPQSDAEDLFSQPSVTKPAQRPAGHAPSNDWLASSLPAASMPAPRNVRSIASNKNKGGSRISMPMVVGIAIACVVVILISVAGIVGIRSLASKPDAPPTPETQANLPPPVAVVPSSQTPAIGAQPNATYPELGPVQTVLPAGVKLHFVRLTGRPGVPGSRTTMQIYIPAGEHQPQSLPCILVAPAGTPMLHGASIDSDNDYYDETLPYAMAGMVVISYSLDGHVPDAPSVSEDARVMLISQAYPEFKASGGGVENGRAAIDFALAKLSMVDPNRIYCAGHSSAGNVSLLLAASDSRINRCVAYAAAYDVQARLGEAADDASMQAIFPGIKIFVQQTSPTNRIPDINCPVLVFHARDDDNVPFTDAEQFVKRMQQAGKDVKLVTANRGGHYSPMINDGIPAAVNWLKTP